MPTPIPFPIPDWFPDFAATLNLKMAPPPESGRAKELQTLTNFPPGSSDWGHRDLADPDPATPEVLEVPIRKLMEADARLALLRLMPAIHAAGMRPETLIRHPRPVLIEARQRGEIPKIEAALKAIARCVTSHDDRKADGKGVTIMAHVPATGRGHDRETATFLAALLRHVSGSAPLIVITTLRTVLPHDAQQMSWTVLRSGQTDGDLVTAAVVERLPALVPHWAMIRKCMPSDTRLRTVKDLALLQVLRSGKPSDVVMELHQLTKAEVPTFSLADFADYGEVYSVATRLAEDVRGLAEGRLDVQRIPRNALLFGPPGNGKTVIAEAIAHAAGVPTVFASLAEWQSAGHLGDMLREMFQTFEKAAAIAPCIVVIDEIDVAGSRESRGGDHNRNYRAQVIAALLQFLDGAYTVPGVTIIGCCNRPEDMDPALQRSGRFDLRLEVPRPCMSALRRILRKHLGSDLPDVDDALLPALVGRSAADVAAMVRNARSIARQQGTSLTWDHLHTALGVRSLDRDHRHRVAIHEAGHAVVAHVAGFDRVVSATVGPEGGHVRCIRMRPPVTEDDLMLDIAMMMAGRAAEVLVLGEPSIGAGGGPASDLAAATMKARDIEEIYGLGSCGAVWSDPRATPLSPDVADAVRKRLEDAQVIATEVLTMFRKTLEAFAAALLAEGHLEEARVNVLLEGCGGRR